MASSADILAGKAFVQLYVRDRMFKQQLAENAAMLDEFASYAGQSGSAPEVSGIASTMDDSMAMMYDNTLYLTDATQALNEVLQQVMDTYMGLAEMQTEGITLNATGGAEEVQGFIESLNLDQVPAAMIKGASSAVGEHLIGKFVEGQLVQDLIVKPIENKLPYLFAAKKEGMGDSGTIIAELVQAGSAAKDAAPIMAELVSNTADAGVVMAELASPAAAAATSTTSMATSAVTASTSTTTLSTSLRGLMTTLLPLLAIVLAVAAAFAAFKIAVAAIKLPFQIAYKACEALAFAVKTLASAAVLATRLLYRLGEAAVGAGIQIVSFAVSAARSLGSGAFNAITGGIEGIGSAVSWVGQMASMVGGGIVSMANRILGPLKQAADAFQEHGETVDRLAKGYKISAEAASVYSYIAGQMNRAVGERGGQSGQGNRMMEGRIKSLMQTVKEGTPEFERWRKQAEAAGLILGGDGVESALAMDDAMDRMRDSLKGLWVTLGSAVAPMIVTATEVMAGAVRGVTAWVRQNQGLIASAFRVAKVVAGVGTAIGFIGTALVTIGGAISPFTAALAAVAAGLAIVEYRTGAARSAWDAYKGSVISVYNTVMQYLGPIVDFVREVMDGVWNAVRAGDLKLAAEIAWAGLKVAWIDGLLWLSERTDGIFQSVLQNLAAGNWKAAADGAVGMIQAAWLRLQNTMDAIWVSVLNTADATLISLVNTVDGKVTDIQNTIAPVWELIKKGAVGVWDAIKSSFSSALEMFGIFAEGMKTFGQTFIDWVIKPFALMHPTVGIALAALEKYLAATAKDFGGAFTSTADVIEQKWKSNQSGSLTDADTERLAKEAQQREYASLDRQKTRSDKSRERVTLGEEGLAKRTARRNKEIALQEARGGAGTAASDAAMASEAARQKLAQDQADAKKKMEETAQPGEPKLGGKGKAEGLVVSGVGAYAAQMIGSASTPQEKTVEELRLQREEQKRVEKENARARNLLMDWVKKNNFADMKIAKQIVFDMTS